MSEKEQNIIKAFEKAIPGLSELEKERLLAFGEGLAFAMDMRRQVEELSQES